MTGLPEGWAQTTLGEIATLRGEKISPASVTEASFIGLEDIEPNTSKILKIGKASDVKSSVAVFSTGDVLYSRLRPYLNKVAVAEFDGVASAEILVMRPTEATTAEFIRRRIMTPEFLDFAASLDKGDRPRVGYAEISRFPINLPPLLEQKRIVAKVDGLTARTARARVDLNRIPTLITQYKRFLLALAFSGELTAKWRKAQGYPTQYSGLPYGWSIRPLGEISEIQGGIQVGKKRPSSATLVEVPYLRVANVQRGWLNLSEIKTILVTESERDRLLLESGDILMNEGGDRDKLGRGWIWRAQVPFCVHQNHVFRIRLRDKNFPPEFVSHFANENGQKYFFEQGTQTTNLASISKRKVEALPVPMPPNEEAFEIMRHVNSAFSWLDRMANEHAAAARFLHKLEAAILSKALAGEIVPQDPNDEPASVLLERTSQARSAVRRPKRQTRKPGTMKKKPSMASLLDDWPTSGMTFEELRGRATGTYDQIKEELFELMTGDQPKIRQEFDASEKTMRLKTVDS